MKNNNEERIKNLAHSVIELAKNSLLVNFRFMDRAIASLDIRESDETEGIATDGSEIIYNPRMILKMYREENEFPARAYLHMVMHCIFRHFIISSMFDARIWNLACDMTVENILNSFDVPCIESSRRNRQQIMTDETLAGLKIHTAEKIYYHLLEKNLSDEELSALEECFCADSHDIWYLPGHRRIKNKKTEKQSEDNASSDEKKEHKSSEITNRNDYGNSDNIQNYSHTILSDESQKTDTLEIPSDKAESAGSAMPAVQKTLPDSSQSSDSDTSDSSDNSSQNDENSSDGAPDSQNRLLGTSDSSSQGAAADTGIDSEFTESSMNGSADMNAEASDGSDNISVNVSDSSENENIFYDNSFGASQKELENLWSEISRDMKTDLETFSQKQGRKSACLMQNLKKVNREKYDYEDFLKRFSVMGEVMGVNNDEFDQVFYTYGLKLYGKMPLIEPLEYKEDKRIREFVIAIDTSGSVSGPVVQSFIQKTYNILKQSESFFTKINVHIIQCDYVIRDDARITSDIEFEKYMQNLTLKGFGGTDFRPVFEYVEKLREEREFNDLRGLIYFSDGYGDFPDWVPDYNTAFVFLDDGENNYNVPVWAIRLVLDREDII